MIKNTKALYLSLGIIGVGLVIIFLGTNLFKSKPREVISEKNTNRKVYSTGISMMLETSKGSGEYVETTDTTWAHAIEKGYIFNETMSKCENGGTLVWDDTNKTIKFMGISSDRCYVYFDLKSLETLAEHITSLYKNDGESELYKHDGEGTYGEYEAGDNSIRYTGASPSNYVCFGSNAETCPADNLYRIIGVFNEKIKLIKSDYANVNLLGTGQNNSTYSPSSYPNYKGSKTSIDRYYWSGASSNKSNTWSTSTLNTIALNKTYLNNIGEVWSNMIANVPWKIGGNTRENIRGDNAKTAYQAEITNPTTTGTDGKTEDIFKVGLMYVNDYYYAANPKYWSYKGYNESDTDTTTDYRAAIKENWMYAGITEWTVFRRSDISTNAFFIGRTGYVDGSNVSNSSYTFAVRPSFYLESTVELAEGNGTVETPYRIATNLAVNTLTQSNKTTTSFRVAASAIKGTADISSYHFAQVTENEICPAVGDASYSNTGATNYKEFMGLTKGTTYKVCAYVTDANGRTSSIKSQNFKTFNEYLATYITNFYTSDGAGGLYKHDGQGTYGAYEAGDNSYRYAGANPNNYVCFGSTANPCPDDNLYRIIGIFDGRMKLIKKTMLASTMQWDSNGSNKWATASLKTYLNGTYITSLEETWSGKIATTTWKVGGNTSSNISYQTNAKTVYQKEITNPATADTVTSKIGLMYATDYMYASDPTKVNSWSALQGYNSGDSTKDYRAVKANNWMAAGINEWTITRNSDAWNSVFLVSGSGYVASGYNYSGYEVTDSYGVRPVFYLKSSVELTDGNGTIESPFTIN